MSEQFESVDKIEWTEGDKEFHKRIMNVCPSEDDKCAMIITLLGQAGMLCEYVASNIDPAKAPLPVVYAITLTAANMIAFLSDEPVKFKKLDGQTGINEQTNEHIFRKMKYIIETLHADLENMEKELKLENK